VISLTERSDVQRPVAELIPSQFIDWFSFETFTTIQSKVITALYLKSIVLFSNLICSLDLGIYEVK